MRFVARFAFSSWISDSRSSFGSPRGISGPDRWPYHDIGSTPAFNDPAFAPLSRANPVKELTAINQRQGTNTNDAAPGPLQISLPSQPLESENVAIRSGKFLRISNHGPRKV